MFKDYLLYISLLSILIFILLPFLLNYFSEKANLTIECNNVKYYIYEEEGEQTSELTVETKKLFGLIKNRQTYDQNDEEYHLIKNLILNKSIFTI